MNSNKAICPYCNNANSIDFVVLGEPVSNLKLEVKDEKIICNICGKQFLVYVDKCEIEVKFSLKTFKL